MWMGGGVLFDMIDKVLEKKDKALQRNVAILLVNLPNVRQAVSQLVPCFAMRIYFNRMISITFF